MTARVQPVICTCGKTPHTESCPSWHRPNCPVCARLEQREKATT